jgi:hypothetical protein
MEEIRKIIRETVKIVFESKEIEDIDNRTKLAVFDFDSTLVDSPLPDIGKKIWKEKTGLDWEKGWWANPNSLNMKVFDIPTIDSTISDYRKEWSDPKSLVVMLTGRSRKVSKYVMNVLNNHGLKFDDYLFKEGNEETSDSKISHMEMILKYNPNIRVVEMWDDRDEHVNSFKNWGQEMIDKGYLDDFIFNHVQEVRKMEENVGPGPSDNVPTSNVFMDIENEKFQSDDFKRDYDPDNNQFWYDKEELKNPKIYTNSEDALSDENDLDKNDVKKIDRNYRDLKRKMNWKRKS